MIRIIIIVLPKKVVPKAVNGESFWDSVPIFITCSYQIGSCVCHFSVRVGKTTSGLILGKLAAWKTQIAETIISKRRHARYFTIRLQTNFWFPGLKMPFLHTITESLVLGLEITLLAHHHWKLAYKFRVCRDVRKYVESRNYKMSSFCNWIGIFSPSLRVSNCFEK